MKQFTVIVSMLICTAGTALAGSSSDTCLQEEKELKAKESSSCSGLSYLLNPSPCYAARRALKDLRAGVCRDIISAEKSAAGTVATAPEKVTPPQRSAEPKRPVKPEPPRMTVAREIPAAEQAKPPATLGELQAENARLRAEIIRLTNENNQLKQGRQ